MDMLSDIPWQMAEDWNQVLLSFKAVENKCKDTLTDLLCIAKKIQKNYEMISEPMESLCACTCVNCEDVCCMRATIWFDFKDLLYIYFATGKFPGSQIKKITLKNQIRTCGSLTQKGCILSRKERPFVCTWYLCPTQKEYLKQYYPKRLLDFEQISMNIKELRKKIEEEFISISF
ncbi:MAG: hypothetical protein RQ739_11070 [Desulfotignum sp.]|nr:hypothetical protein [Desulfotignum sp.]